LATPYATPLTTDALFWSVGESGGALAGAGDDVVAGDRIGDGGQAAVDVLRIGGVDGVRVVGVGT